MNQPTSFLEQLGFQAFFRQQLSDSITTPGRVLRVTGNRCELLTADGPAVAVVPRRLRHPPPVVGDWLLIQPQPTGDPLVTQRLTRRTQLARAAAGTRTQVQVLAANVDRVFVVMGLDGDFNLRRLERYLAMCADTQVDIVVFLTKAGLCADPQDKLTACRGVCPPGSVLAVHTVDVFAGIHPELPQTYAQQVTVALVGSSGAGKSTLVNHILGRSVMATASVREDDSRGRHTTTHRELHLVPGGGVVIDNPGIRELGLWIERDGLQQAFCEVASLADNCRFRDCTHRHEPGCAVLAARDAGTLDADRLANYDRLQHEVAATARRRDERTRRADDRRLGKLYRRVQRERRRQRGE